MNIDEGFVGLSAALNPQAQLLEVVRLTGGVSADVRALTLRNADGETFKVVVRQHPDRTFKERSADLIRLEYQMLVALYGAGLPVPEPLMLDVTGEIVPAPALVMTYVEGSAEIDNDDLSAQMDEMAQVLCADEATCAGISDLRNLREGDHLLPARLLQDPDSRPVLDFAVWLKVHIW